MRPNIQTIKPLRREIKLSIGWQRISTMKNPKAVMLDSNPAMTFGISKEKHEVHFGREPKLAGHFGFWLVNCPI
jgi:hypothetical protein